MRRLNWGFYLLNLSVWSLWWRVPAGGELLMMVVVRGRGSIDVLGNFYKIRKRDRGREPHFDSRTRTAGGLERRPTITITAEV